MDISKLNIVKASEEGIDVEITNPIDDKPIGLKIRVVGAMSNNYRDDMVLLLAEIEDFKEQNKLPDNATKRQKAEMQLKIEKFDDELTSKFLAKYTIGWEGMEENGKEIKFSQSEAERIYREYTLIRGQVQKGMMDISNFIKA